MDTQKKKQLKTVFLNIMAVVICVIILLPIYWMVNTALKKEVDIFKTPPTLFPTYFYPNAFIQQFTGDYNTLKAFFNSAVISLGAMLISIVLGIPAAYALARFKFKGKKLMILSFLVTQMLPTTLLLTPLFLIFRGMNLLNTYLAPIIGDSTIGIPFIVLILRTYFVSIPKELDDAARIDGCGTLRSFFKIMVPIAFPGIVVAAVFSYLFAWGDLVYGITYINEESLRPITAGIYAYMTMYGTSWNLLMAFGFIAVLPVLLIVIFMQKYIVSGLTGGAVKG